MTTEQNIPSSDVSVTQASDPPVTGTPASSGETPQKPATTTLEEALARIAELEHSHKNAREQADRQAKKLTAYEKAEQDKKDAELSELERTKKQHAELQAKHDTYTKQMHERVVRYEVERQASKLGIIDPEAASKLMDWSELEYDESGNPTNAEKLLEKLLKHKPYLAPKQETPANNPPARGGTPVIPAMNPGRSNIAPPDALPPGKLSIAEAYAASQRQRS